MAVDQQTAEVHLKYLDIFRLIVLKATSYVASIYEYAKESSGPLKPGVDSVEGTVKTVVGPVYKQFHSKPAEFLQFIDSKVDAAVSVLEEAFPQFIRQTSVVVYELVSQAPEAARTVLADVNEQGVYETAKNYYEKYEPYAEELSYKAFQKFLSFPFVPQIVDLVAPTALYSANKLNQVVLQLKEHHLPLSEYIPRVPVETIERIIRKQTAADSKDSNGGGVEETAPEAKQSAEPEPEESTTEKVEKSPSEGGELSEKAEPRGEENLSSEADAPASA